MTGTPPLDAVEIAQSGLHYNRLVKNSQYGKKERSDWLRRPFRITVQDVRMRGSDEYITTYYAGFVTVEGCGVVLHDYILAETDPEIDYQRERDILLQALPTVIIEWERYRA